MSERLEAWRGYLDLLESVNASTTSARGYEFLRNARPTRPVLTEYIHLKRATRILWSDGIIELIDDLDLHDES